MFDCGKLLAYPSLPYEAPKPLLWRTYGPRNVFSLALVARRRVAPPDDARIIRA